LLETSFQKENPSSSNADVVVIGAGAAGLSASSEFLKQGKSVICVEAMNRIGGRCFTDHRIFGIPYDIGAHWMHNYSGNHLAKYGIKNSDKFDVYKIKENLLVYDGLNKTSSNNLKKNLNDIKTIKNEYLDIKNNLKRNKKLPFKDDIPFINQIPTQVKENDWFGTAHQAMGACLAGVDFNNFTIYDEFLNYKEIGEGDGFVKEGYGSLVANLRKEVPVKLNTIVKEIKWDGKGVVVETSQGTIKSKICVVTVSTEVLNTGIIKFTPKLPLEKYEAFNGIKLGLYNHITLQLKDEFYKNFEILPDTYLFSKIKNTVLPPKGFFGSLRLHETNLSYFDVGGQFAENLEKEGERASIDFVTNSLRSTFGSNFDQFVIKAHATSWGKNKFSLGSYSSAKPGKAHLRGVLKSSVGDRIFFAGEATSLNYGTVHGADLSGKEVADDVINLLKI
jgi:monoamine oxidase